MEDFINLLSQMVVEDNQIRDQAHNVFNEAWNSQPNQTVGSLMEIATGDYHENLRQYCFILLRKVLLLPLAYSDEKLFVTFSDEMRQNLVQSLLVQIGKETHFACMKAAADVVSDLVRVIYRDMNSSWGDIVPWCLNGISSDNVNLRNATFRILNNIFGYICKSPVIHENFAHVVQSVGNSLGNEETQITALLFAKTMIDKIYKEQKESLVELIDPMLNVIAACLNRGDEQDAEEAVKVFIEIAGTNSTFLKPKLTSITDAMISLASTDVLSEDVNRLAAEFLISLAENKPILCQKNPSFVQSCVNILLKLMVETIPDVPLEELPSVFDSVEIMTFLVAEEYLDRISSALSDEYVVPVIFSFLEEFSNHQQWRYRHACLKALSMIGEGCSIYLSKGIEDIGGLMINSLSDSDARVRFAALSATGQLCSDLGPEFQIVHHASLLPVFINALGEHHVKIKIAAAGALVNFCSRFDGILLQPYLQQILSVLVTLLENENSMVIEHGLNAVCAIASLCKKSFSPYYDVFIGPLKQLFFHSTAESQKKVRGLTMYTIASIGLAVGREVFEKDAHEVLSILQEAQAQITDAGDPQKPHFLDSWMKICTCLESGFIPYLPFIIEPLFKAAVMEPNVKWGDGEQEQGWEYIELDNGSTVAVDVYTLDDQILACSHIYFYASQMKEHFFPYVDRAMEIMTKIMEQDSQDDLRAAAYLAIPEILNSAYLNLSKKGAPLGYVENLFNECFPRLYRSVHEYVELVVAEGDSLPTLYDSFSEPLDLTILQYGFESMHKCISVLKTNCLPDEMISILINEILSVFQYLRTFRETIVDSYYDDDEDQNFVMQEDVTLEEPLISEMVELTGTFASYHKESYMKIINETGFLDFCKNLVQDGYFSEKMFAICFFDDLVENYQEQAFGLFEHFVPHLLQHYKSTHPGLRQSCTYGLGVLIERGGNLVSPHLKPIMDCLFDVIGEEPESKSLASGRDNAISSLTKALVSRGNELGNEIYEIGKYWLSVLPLEYDIIEGRIVHNELCDLIEKFHPDSPLTPQQH
eukprot:TRINITY_DN4416_c0_g1_i1.p1 TRINITY_DN4416_c0_g1~~TRINITY_DN4416_c0_g1_i1.p1  ORF type:complete len:1060 (+),score=269.92 TRINITY_DN4416_c0_g1_i1:50-3181(+)